MMRFGKFLIACVIVGAATGLTRGIFEGVTGYDADFSFGMAAGFAMAFIWHGCWLCDGLGWHQDARDGQPAGCEDRRAQP